MKGQTMNYGLLCLCVLFCFAGCNQSPQPDEAKAKQKLSHGQETTKRIAIVTPVTHPSLEQIQEGFITTLEQNKNYSYAFDVFNANGKETLLRAQTEEVASKDYDLIFTIAAHPTCVAKEILTKRQKTTPLVFGAVANPVGLGIVPSETQPGSFITGVTESIDHQKQLDALLSLKPAIKQILLVYNPAQGAGLENNKDVIAKILQEKNIGLTCAQVYTVNEIQAKVAGLIPGHDALLVLKDNTVVPAMPCLAQLCSRHNVILCSSDLDSSKHGAMFSFGVHERDFGIEAAKKALLILHKGEKPGSIPVSRLENYKIIFNQKTL